MTLDEAIWRETALAESFRKRIESMETTDAKPLERMEQEHRQMAKWLRELVHLRNITEYLRDMVTCFEFMDSMHYNEDIIEWAESELRVDMREVKADECNL